MGDFQIRKDVRDPRSATAGPFVRKSTQTNIYSDPATEEVIGTCPEFTKHDTDAAIAAAAEAFQTFRTTTPRERARLLRRWHDLMIQHQEDIAYLITLENGKAMPDAKGEAAYAASFLEWFSEEAPRTYGDMIPATVKGNQVITVKDPVGVCALITP